MGLHRAGEGSVRVCFLPLCRSAPVNAPGPDALSGMHCKLEPTEGAGPEATLTEVAESEVDFVIEKVLQSCLSSGFEVDLK